VAEEEPRSNASERGRRELEEHLAQAAEEEERLGAEARNCFPLFFLRSFLLPFSISHIEGQFRGIRRPLHDGDLRKIRSGEETVVNLVMMSKVEYNDETKKIRARHGTSRR